MNKVKLISSWAWPYEDPFVLLKENFTEQIDHIFSIDHTNSKFRSLFTGQPQ